MAIKSLIINPGSTSTKIGVFEDETLLFEETLRHSTEEIAQYASIVDQKDSVSRSSWICLIKRILTLSPAGCSWPRRYVKAHSRRHLCCQRRAFT